MKRDPLFAKGAHVVATEGRASVSLLQRKLNVGYTRAARTVDQLADHRVIGPYEGSKSREVLMNLLEVDELVRDRDDATGATRRKPSPLRGLSAPAAPPLRSPFAGQLR